MRILAFILVFMIGSCKLTKSNIAGTYHDYYNFENSTSLEINSDQTFNYSMQAGLVFFRSSGKWKIVGDTLLLTNADTTSIIELKQLKFLIKGRKLKELREKKMPGVTLRRIVHND